jgi:hypothetical protein
MATVIPTVEVVSGKKLLIRWIGLASGDDGAPVEISDYIDRDAQYAGGLPGGAALQIQGSNDLAGPWSQLAVPGPAPSGWIGASKNDVPVEARYMRPAIVGGSATAIDVILFCSY